MDFKRRVFCCGLILVATSNASFGQDSDTEEEAQAAGTEVIEEVIVIGVPTIDRSLADIKRESFTTKDSLNFDALEFFPDASIGSAFNQVAGAVAVVDPTSGQPRFISLRGFGAQYNSVDFDGIAILNSSANTRGTRLDLFPSSLVHELNVFKAVTPDMDGNSVGGHASVRTLRAFDGGTQPFFNSKLQIGAYDHDDEPDRGKDSYRLDAVGKFTFGENSNYGAVFGLDAQRHGYAQDSQHFNDGYFLIDGFDVPERDTVYNATVFQTDIERLNGFAKLEARISDKLYGFASAHYFSQDEIESRNLTGHFVDFAEAISIDAGRVTYSETQGIVSFVDRNRGRETRLASFGLDYVVGDDSLLTLRASHSRADLDTSFEQSRGFLARAPAGSAQDDVSIGFSKDEIDVRLPDSSVFGDTGMFVQEGRTGGTFNQFNDVEDALSAIRLDYAKNMHPDSSGFGYKTGISMRRIDRTFDRSLLRYRVSDADQAAYTLAVNNPSLGRVSSLDTIFIDRNAYWEFVKARNINSGTATGDDFKPDIFNFEADYALVEDVYAGYGMISYAVDDIRAIAGLRAESTSVLNEGFIARESLIARSTSVTPDRVDYSYLDLLPSVHLIYSPNNTVTMRASYSRTIARPDFRDFAQRSSTEAVVEDGRSREEVYVGDPRLEARHADNLDLSGEYYFQDYDGYVSAALFYKKIGNEHFRRISTSFVDGVEIETSEVRDDSTARVVGLEVNFVMNSLDFLPRPLNLFGLRANYTFSNGEWEMTGPGGTTRVINGLRSQADHLARLMMRFRWNRFGADWTVAYRGDYFTGRLGETSQNDVYVEDLARVTLSQFYWLSDRFTLHFVARDVYKPRYLEVSGSARNLVRRVIQPEPSFWLGLKYRL